MQIHYYQEHPLAAEIIHPELGVINFWMEPSWEDVEYVSTYMAVPSLSASMRYEAQRDVPQDLLDVSRELLVVLFRLIEGRQRIVKGRLDPFNPQHREEAMEILEIYDDLSDLFGESLLSFLKAAPGLYHQAAINAPVIVYYPFERNYGQAYHAVHPSMVRNIQRAQECYWLTYFDEDRGGEVKVPFCSDSVVGLGSHLSMKNIMRSLQNRLRSPATAIENQPAAIAAQN